MQPCRALLETGVGEGERTKQGKWSSRPLPLELPEVQIAQPLGFGVAGVRSHELPRIVHVMKAQAAQVSLVRAAVRAAAIGLFAHGFIVAKAINPTNREWFD